MEIPTTYNVATCNYRLEEAKELNDNKTKAIYKDIDSDNYEVIIIRKNTNKERFINGRKVVYKPYILPRNEDFGKYGWHYTKKDKAQDKYDSITL